MMPTHQEIIERLVEERDELARLLAELLVNVQSPRTRRDGGVTATLCMPPGLFAAWRDAVEMRREATDG